MVKAIHKKRKVKKVLTEAQKKELVKKKKEAAFKKKIKTTFVDAGFEYLHTEGKEFKIGHRVVELDYLFIDDNIILICEDTCGNSKDKEHIRKKSESFREIEANRKNFLEWIGTTFPDKNALVTRYRAERYLIYYLYIPQNAVNLTDDERDLYGNLFFVEPETLSYFYKMVQCIHYSAKYEIYRYLGIKDEQFGNISSESSKTTIKAPIIYPEDVTGLRNGVRVVSFMMSAEKLLRTCYVLRKDNWEESMFLYQRLIEKEKVKSIRAFLATKGEAFYNNIIVALPDNVTFEDDSSAPIPIDRLGDFQHCKLVMPDEMNSICVIDGQHRIFAHYEAPSKDKYEHRIAELRKQLHLLVTGLIFPKEMSDVDRKQIQSEIFLDINHNTKKVAPNVLTHIEMIKDPYSDIGLARRVIEKLNRQQLFHNRFELSELDEEKIKVSSIIKFALRYLVTIRPVVGKTSLFAHWDGDKDAMLNKNEEALNTYIDFCAKQIALYFSSVRDVYRTAWNDPQSKILSVISLNGFIIALNRQLVKNGLGDHEFYNKHFQKMEVDFSKEGFPYTSSQYRKFSNKILEDAFGFSSEELSMY